MISTEDKARFLKFQINEITEYHIYKRLAQFHKKEENRQILAELSKEELSHYQLLKKFTGELPPQRWEESVYIPGLPDSSDLHSVSN